MHSRLANLPFPLSRLSRCERVAAPYLRDGIVTVHLPRLAGTQHRCPPLTTKVKGHRSAVIGAGWLEKHPEAPGTTADILKQVGPTRLRVKRGGAS